jgi:hypothetical protein
MDESECRTADVFGIDTEPLSQPPHERGLPRSQVSRQQDHIPGNEAACQIPCDRGRFRF